MQDSSEKQKKKADNLRKHKKKSFKAAKQGSISSDRQRIQTSVEDNQKSMDNYDSLDRQPQNDSNVQTVRLVMKSRRSQNSGESSQEVNSKSITIRENDYLDNNSKLKEKTAGSKENSKEKQKIKNKSVSPDREDLDMTPDTIEI